MIGNDVVMDYSRGEGDRIVIEGHTTKILSVDYGDANGDGVMDHSVIRLYSDQGNNGGAHNDDRLGSITVYGDLVKMSDIETTAALLRFMGARLDVAPPVVTVDTQRLDKPYVRENGRLRPASWQEAFAAIKTKVDGAAAACWFPLQHEEAS